jgi:2-polyprenyl-3-methyl-5-hydroxy-6-metoxy-1,4-benzoquinol methylase
LRKNLLQGRENYFQNLSYILIYKIISIEITKDFKITNSKKFLNQVYKYKTDSETKDLYDQWYLSYDQELANNNYITPKRCSEALDRHLSNKNGVILDLGCGTGLSGKEIILKGFNQVDGTDFSEKMLHKAKLKKIYRNLFLLDLNNNVFNLENNYDAIIAAGVISPNHAKPKALKSCLKHMKPNGLIIFSLNDHAYNDIGFMKEIDSIIDNFKLKILEKEYGEHLSKIHLKSWIYVLKK